MAQAALNRLREGAWHSGKAFPSARDLALGEGLFPVNRFPGRPSPSVAIGEAFPRGKRSELRALPIGAPNATKVTRTRCSFRLPEIVNEL
jgi:hypothetical protein